MLLQKQEHLPVDKADLDRLPYHSIYLVKRDLHPPSNQLLYQSRGQIFYPSTTFGSRKTFQTCTNCTWKPGCPEYSSLWRTFSSATLQPYAYQAGKNAFKQRHEWRRRFRDETPHGIREFNPAAASFPSTPYMFNYPNLHNELNYVCPHCNSMLWKEERNHRLKLL